MFSVVDEDVLRHSRDGEGRRLRAHDKGCGDRRDGRPAQAFPATIGEKIGDGAAQEGPSLAFAIARPWRTREPRHQWASGAR